MSAQNTIYAFREDRGGSKCGLAGRLSESKSRLVSLILNIFSFLKLVNSFLSVLGLSRASICD